VEKKGKKLLQEYSGVEVAKKERRFKWTQNRANLKNNKYVVGK
jgi:hypothetical protein